MSKIGPIHMSSHVEVYLYMYICIIHTFMNHVYIYIYVYLVFMGNNPQESLNPCGVLGRLSFCNQRGRLWRPCHGTTGDLRGAAWRGEASHRIPCDWCIYPHGCHTFKAKCRYIVNIPGNHGSTIGLCTELHCNV